MTENDKDIELLRSDPHAVILKYQETVKIIVKKYILSGVFGSSDFEDILQEINMALLAKIPAMQSHYNGLSLFKTYFSVIVRNICMKEHAKINKEPKIEQKDIDGYIDCVDVEEKFVFEKEILRFRDNS